MQLWELVKKSVWGCCLLCDVQPELIRASSWERKLDVTWVRTGASGIPRQSLTLSKYGDMGDLQEKMLSWLLCVASSTHTWLRSCRRWRRISNRSWRSCWLAVTPCQPGEPVGQWDLQAHQQCQALDPLQNVKNGCCFASLFQTRKIFSCGKLNLGTRQRRTFWKMQFQLS